MKTTTAFTPQQITDFHAYVRVQKSNRFNMMTHARQAMSAAGLDKAEYFFVLENYEALQAAAEATKVTAPTTPALTADQTEYCINTLTTAIEGGINYWAEGRKFKRQPEVEGVIGMGYLSCQLRPNAGEGTAFADGDARNDWQDINVEKLSAAVQKIITSKDLCRKDIREDILVDWHDANACRSDAETADVIVQIALFGEIVFG